MFELKIKKQSLATRCEICHKSDHFDREKSSCSRCEKLIITKSDKGHFIINWHIDLRVLSNTLRNFTWQNIDSRVMKCIRLVLGVGIILSIIMLFVDYQIASSIDEYYIPPLPGSQTEGFTKWGLTCGVGSQLSLQGVLLVVVFFI